MHAVSALAPAWGAAAACDGTPVYSNVSHRLASAVWARRSRSAGWNIIAASSPSNAPASSSLILPPPPSSAGVPSSTTSPPVVATTRAAARNAPTAPAAIRLCPHAWPISGSASYSATIATRAPPAVPARARSAVGRPPSPRSTAMWRDATSSEIHPAALTSWKRSSGLAWRLADRAIRSWASADTASSIAALSCSGIAMPGRSAGRVAASIAQASVRGPDVDPVVVERRAAGLIGEPLRGQRVDVARAGGVGEPEHPLGHRDAGRDAVADPEHERRLAALVGRDHALAVDQPARGRLRPAELQHHAAG